MELKKPKKQSGQTLVEFLFVTIMILTVLFLFVQLAWSLAWGHYVHYATYMASRALLSGDKQEADQMDHAATVLRQLLKKGGGTQKDLLQFIAQPRTGDERDIASGPEPVLGAFIGTHPNAVGNMTLRSYSWAEGVQYNFKFRLYLLPLASWANKEKGKTITYGASGDSTSDSWDGYVKFTSDSWLGRDPSVRECNDYMQRLSNSMGINRADGQTFLYDNGC